jgi:hypothetical protein
MSYNNFKATVWSKYIQLELERKCILADFCNKNFEGDAKHNETVKILGVGTPTIGDYTGVSIGSPETIDDSSIFMRIDQAKFFNFMIDDIDKAQAQPGLMEAILTNTTRAMASARDKHVATMAKNAGAFSSSTQINTKAAAKTIIDAAILQLRENDVEVDNEVVIEVPYFVYLLFKDNLADLKTNNDELVKKGIVGMYDNCLIRTSNNLYNDGTDYYAMVRTKDAIAFAGGIDKTEAYRPEELFSDAMKGLNCFGSKVVRPKELYVMKVHK